MSERPVKGDIPDESPIPDHLKEQDKKEPLQQNDSPDNAPESGDKQP